MALLRPSGKAFLQILWTGSDVSIPCLFLFTDSKRYVFNCGEGIQRLFTQRKIKLSKLDTFFLTRYQWSHMGGLPGFGMTLRDIKNMPFREKMRQNASSDGNVGANSQYPQSKLNTPVPICKTSNITSSNNDGVSNASNDIRTINVYAPEGMKDVLSATKHFLRFDDSDVNFVITEHQHENRGIFEAYKDNEIIVQSIPIYNKNSKSQVGCQLLEDNNIRTVNISHSHTPSLCYVCDLRPLPGKFNVTMAKKMGVPAGPLFGTLQRGEVVKLPDGKIVTPEDVLGPEVPGPKFLIIDCPTVLYIETLIQNSNLSKYLSEDEGLNLVIHLSPKTVYQNGAYSEWVQKFPSSTRHIYMNNLAQESVAFDSQYCLQIMLNRIHPKIFPLTAEHKIMNDPKIFPHTAEHKIMNGKRKVSNDLLKNFVKVYVRELINKPTKAFDDSEVKSKIDLSELICRVNKVLNVEGKCDATEKDDMNMNRKRLSEEDLDPVPHKKGNFDHEPGTMAINSKSDSLSMYPKIVCLGTGASLPSKYRNVSSTLIFLSEDNAVIFDCGEGTYGQLLCHYGDNIDNILSKIKFIFISHMHADHHLGLITLITKINSLKQTDNNSFIIMAPTLLYEWLTSYASVSEPLKFDFINCENAYQGIYILEDLLYVEPVKVHHPGCAHGVVLKYDRKIKITYSGDTMPCNALIASGKNSTLLIHEATLEDDMIEDAKDRRHSTTAQALDVAQKMNAEFVLLNHFSQRYPKMPIVANNRLSSKVCFAFDHMELSLNDFEHFYKLVPVLNALLSEDGVV